MQFPPKRPSACTFRFRLTLLCLFSALLSSAQFHQFRKYNVGDGLPSSEVYAMMQDAAGYLWFTTDMGVSRFDGYGFRNFSMEDGMADNTIFGVTQDVKGRIWFRSFSGRLCYFLNDHFYTLPCNTTIGQQLGDALMTSLYVDAGDTIWIGTARLFALKIAPGWKQVTRVDIPEPDGGYLCLFENDNFIYGGGMRPGCSLSVFQRTNRHSYSVPLYTDANCPGVGIRYTVIRLANGDFAATSNTAITCFNAGGVTGRSTLPATGICLAEDGDGKIFAGTDDGAFCWSDGKLLSRTPVAGFDQKVVTAICRDRENSLWFCTEGNGVLCIPHRSFLYYTFADGLPESKISCIAAAPGGVLAGHLDGSISVMNGASIRTFFPPEKMANGQSARMSSLLCFDAQHLYAGSISTLYTLNDALTDAHPLAIGGTKKLAAARDGNMYSLRFRNILKYDPDNYATLQMIRMDVFTDNFYEDRSGKLWICTISGLWTYDADSGLTYLGKNEPLLASRIVDLQEASDGSMWMVSRGNGVIVKRGAQLYNITRADGLSGNMCRTLLLDSANVVWVGTNNGLNRITVTSEAPFRYSIGTFTSRNGLLTNEVNYILRSDGKLWAVHNNGISIFDPVLPENNAQPPPVYIILTLVNGDTVRATDSTFAYDRNYFNFQFIGLSFKEPGTVEYKYKLEGIDSGWVHTTYTSVKYQTLPPGSYRFLVYARNNDGYWSRTPATLNFIVLPPWWQTWWFKLTAAAGILALLLLVSVSWLRMVRRRDRKKAALQNRVAAIELTALRAQMNPHFVFNAINSVQYFITNNDPDSSQKYLSKFARLIRYVLDNARLASIPVRREIEALELYLDLEALRFGKRFSYTIDVHPGVDKDYTQIPSMLIQPYVENAIWHGIMHSATDGRIRISLAMSDDVLRCTIEDNGIGRKRSQALRKEKDAAHRSIGMANTQERLDILNQINNSALSVSVTDLYAANGEACGTRVELNIPCS